MTNTIISNPDPQARVRQLLSGITVTTLEGRVLPEMAKRGRVFAACRGHVPTLVRIDWGSTSPDEVRAALDEMRGTE